MFSSLLQVTIKDKIEHPIEEVLGQGMGPEYPLPSPGPQLCPNLHAFTDSEVPRILENKDAEQIFQLLD